MSYSTASKAAQARAAAAEAASQAMNEAKKAVTSITGEFETEESIETICVDALVAMKIVSHAADTPNTISAGQLLGLDTAGVLDVSDCYPFPANHIFPIPEAIEERDRDHSRRKDDAFDVAATNAASYTAQFLPRLAEINSDANVVGFYATTSYGQIAGPNGALIEALARYQLGSSSDSSSSAGISSKLRPKVAAERKNPGKGIALIYDSTSSTSETVSLRAFRLTDAYLAVHKAGRFDSASLAEFQTTPSNIFKEFPVKITRSAMLSAFLSSLALPENTSTNNSLGAPSFLSLSLPTNSSTSQSSLTLPLQSLLTSFDSSINAINSLRFKDRRNQKSANPDSHLEAIKSLAAAEGAAHCVSEQTGIAISRLYGAKAVQA